MAAIILFGAFLLLILFVPIGYAIGIATLVAITLTDCSLNFVTIAQKAITGVDSFPLMAIPFFMLAGNLMSSGGIAKRIVDLADKLLGWISGGLGMATTLTCMFFAAISGSAVATTSAVGSFMIPQMEKHGYPRHFSASITAAAGTIGVIIPPSIPFVIYGVCTGTSISDLFVAGLIPGIGMGIALMIVCYIEAKRHGYNDKEGREKVTAKALGKSFLDAFWAILSPAIILGGIYSGHFTPTESAVVACVYSFIAGKYIYKELTWKTAYDAFRDAIVINGATTFMVGFSMAFAAYLTMEHIPTMMADFMVSITDNPILLLLMINCLLLIIGCLIDNIPATIILSPILLPVVESLGMSPVTFGIMLTMNLAIGFVTPPYGIDLFVASAISGESIGNMMKSMKWCLLALVAVLMLTTYWKPFTMMFLT